MITVTTSRPATADDLEALLPIWQNADGDQFVVSSGQLDTAPEGAWTPDSEAPAPQAPAVIAGMDGLEALAAMGLVPVGDA
jgi:hypothetical protein